MNTLGKVFWYALLVGGIGANIVVGWVPGNELLYIMIAMGVIDIVDELEHNE